VARCFGGAHTAVRWLPEGSWRRALLCAVFVLPGVRGAADTIRVDAAPEHLTNSIRPTEALGAGVDRLPYGAADKLFTPETIARVLSAGWQTVTYRQNTELHAEAWHWNPRGAWSGPGERGYFVGEASPGAEPIVHSYGYPLPRRGVTRDDGTDTIGYSRLTDGDGGTFWKSNPYLTQALTGEDDAAHPQWVILDLASRQKLNALRIDWAAPYARDYVVQFWTGEDPIKKPAAGSWQRFAHGTVSDGHGGSETLRLADLPVEAQFVRILMTRSSNTCVAGTHGDRRDCMGFAIAEVSLGTLGEGGRFHDLIRHTPDQDQTATYCSSIDPWHESGDLDEKAGEQVGFDRFFSSGITRGLPTMIPIAMLYSTPEDAVAELGYLKRRGYPISNVEMGEEPDGHYTVPEDYAALYLQFAAALHRLDPGLKLGGPIFTGQNEDIQTWPDAHGNTSWTGRFIDYLRAHGGLSELAFFSFEHYPIDPGKIAWSSLYDEARLVTHIMQVWREDGVPKEVPLFITESNISWQYSEAYMDLWGGLWLADYVGAFLAGGGSAIYYFHYLPKAIGPGHNGSPGTFNFFSADEDLKIRQPLSQYFASQLINLEWLQPGNGQHRLFAATADTVDGAGHTLISAYPVLRPDGSWALLIINKDQQNAHAVSIRFEDAARHRVGAFTGQVSSMVFGKSEYQWHPDRAGGHADPDGPPRSTKVEARTDTLFGLPAASITVLRGKVAMTAAP
jgi:F5/8 type C domain